MTATEELRCLLGERGVEWGASDTYRLLVTSWNDASGHSWAFMEHRDGSFSKLTAYHLTSEQAVAATLGPGECHMEPVKDYKVSKCATSWGCVCSSCGGFHEFTRGKGWKFCPHCGRRIKEVDE